MSAPMTDAELGAAVRRLLVDGTLHIEKWGSMYELHWYRGFLARPTLDDALRAALAALDEKKE